MSAHGTSILAHRAVSTLHSFPRVSRASSSSRRSASARALPIIAMSAAPAEDVSLVELLSTCVDAARKGCDEIRAVQHRRSTAGGALASTRKDADDPRSALTEADTAAQIAIVNALRTAWPGLRIVGEEEEEESPDKGAALRRDLLDDACAPHPATIAWREPLDVLTVFVDPVDGTREFVEGRLDAVQCLIGIACRGRAVAGAIGLPFPDGDLERPATVEWGVALPGAASGASGSLGDRTPRPRLAPDVVDGAVCVAGDSSNASLAAAKLAASPAGHACIGGAGNKILAVAEGRAEMSIMHFGTSLWDTCAPEGVLRARGGKVSDLFGAPLTHDPERPGGGLINDLGVLATASNLAEVDAEGRDHAALAEAMRADEFTRCASRQVRGGRVRDAGNRPTPGVRRGAVSRRRAAHGEVGGGVRGANAVWGRVREFSSSRVCRAGT